MIRSMYDALLIIPGGCADTGELLSEMVALFDRNRLAAGIFLAPLGGGEKPGTPPADASEHIAGAGTLGDLCSMVSAGKIETRSLWWVDDPQRFMEMPSLVGEIWKGLDAGNDLVIAVRPSVPLREKIPAMVVFPEWKDPFSGLFAVRHSAFTDYASPGLQGPLLAHFLSRVPWNGVREVDVPATDSPGSRHRYPATSWFPGLGQILYYALTEKSSPLRTEMGKILRFALVGLSGILVNTGFLYLFTEVGGLFYLASSAIAIELSIISNFFLNEFWTFKSRSGLIRRRWKRLASYNFLALGGMAVNMVVLYGLTAGFGVYYLTANIIGILFGFLWNYLTNRNITWR
ncbi:dolichol-phosphate mannosyltransferase [Methanolinea mesophila]|uniref:GtrA family protein n=1 Tax=Methanolinea mesophila TaxID=547055 RepID=UPI001AE7A8E1|nr:GtrA family protein [Methanolinea mesophila]MBP1928784.1 dolichol-phosphate mannosyltransferase [Methanolinea mesophila]